MTLNDKDIILILGLLLIVIQFLYRIWDKKDNKELLDAIAAGVQSFDRHIERGKQAYGIVKDLMKMHEARDDDGRPLWYLPKDFIETQREIVRLTHTMATTQAQIVRLMEKMDSKIDDHKSKCERQFNQLDKKFSGK